MQPSPSSKYLLKTICSIGVLLVTDLSTEANPAIAQITSDGSFHTLVNQSAADSCIAAICEITGGRLTDSGSLLLHSFEQFSLSPTTGNQSALFVDPGVDDIIVRVTGNSDSFINGVIAASTGSTANLFFVNPQGIRFGPNAQLNLGGSFTASTASQILFENGIDLATNSALPATAPLLTVNQPIGLGFLADANGNATSAPISVSSTGNLLFFGSRDLPQAQFVNRQLRQLPGPPPPGFPAFSALTVQPSESIRLIGNGIALTGGNLVAAGGQIELGSVAIGDVSFTNTATNVTAATTENSITATNTLNYDKVSAFSDITLSNSASLDVSAPNPGQIFLASRNLSVDQRSAVLAETLAEPMPGAVPGIVTNNAANNRFTGGLIDVNATGLVKISDVPPGTPGPPFFSYLSVDAAPGTINPGGLINLQAQNLTIADGAQIGANTFGAGTAGKLHLTVNNTISLLGSGTFGPSAIFSSSASPGTGNAGRIVIDAGELRLQGGSRVSTTSATTGTTGSIRIKADRIQIEGTTPLIPVLSPDGSINFRLESSAIASRNQGLANQTGQGIEIEVRQLLVTAGGQITAATAGPGAAGNINITADDITVSGSATVTGAVNSGGPSIISTLVAPRASGDGGTLTINSRQLSILNGGQIAAGTASTGNAGDLIVDSQSVLISGATAAGRSGLFASAVLDAGNGGNLSVTAEQLQVLNGGTINVSNFPSSSDSPLPPGRGAAGNLTVAARQITLSDNAILNADTASGDRGNITLTTDILTLRNRSRITTNATEQATGGNININAADGFIVAPAEENSDITANAEFGDGGQVNIVAQDILGPEVRPTLTAQSDITASSEFGAAGETRLETVETEIRADAVPLPSSTEIPAVAQGCNTGGAGRFVQTGRGGTGTTPYGILNSRDSLSDVSLPHTLTPERITEPTAEVIVPLTTTNPRLTEAHNWATNAKGEVVLFAANSHEPDNARCSNWQS